MGTGLGTPRFVLVDGHFETGAAPGTGGGDAGDEECVEGGFGLDLHLSALDEFHGERNRVCEVEFKLDCVENKIYKVYPEIQNEWNLNEIVLVDIIYVIFHAEAISVIKSGYSSIAWDIKEQTLSFAANQIHTSRHSHRDMVVHVF